MYGPQPERRGSPLCAFNVEGVHPTDLSTFLDFEGEKEKPGLFTVSIACIATYAASENPSASSRELLVRRRHARSQEGQAQHMHIPAQALRCGLDTIAASLFITLWA